MSYQPTVSADEAWNKSETMYAAVINNRDNTSYIWLASMANNIAYAEAMFRVYTIADSLMSKKAGPDTIRERLIYWLIAQGIAAEDRRRGEGDSRSDVMWYFNAGARQGIGDVLNYLKESEQVTSS